MYDLGFFILKKITAYILILTNYLFLQEIDLYFQKCLLLHSQGKLDEFYTTCKQLLFHHFKDINDPKFLKSKSTEFIYSFVPPSNYIATFVCRNPTFILDSFILMRSYKPFIDTVHCFLIRHIAITNCPFRFAFSHLPKCGQLLRQKDRKNFT